MRKVIYVLSHEGKWKIQCSGEKDEVVDLKEEAIKKARRRVASLPEGSLSQILAQGEDGKFMEEWTYGEDPFPPEG